MTPQQPPLVICGKVLIPASKNCLRDKKEPGRSVFFLLRKAFSCCRKYFFGRSGLEIYKLERSGLSNVITKDGNMFGADWQWI